MTTVALIATLDTKAEEASYVRGRLLELGCTVLVVDAGVLGEPGMRADVERGEVAAAAGRDIRELAAAGDRGAAVTAMARGAAAVVSGLLSAGRLDGLLAIGGSGAAAIAAAAFRTLPVGVPKLLVSTVASGDVGPYVGESDVTLMYSVVDIAGLNRISRRVLGNAAAAIAGMSKGAGPSPMDGRPVVAATMFGVTTPCVTRARERLEDLGYEVVVFSASGTGGRTLEGLVRDGLVSATLDVTTTELADEFVGGILSAGRDRLTAAGALGLPQVVSVGALDMVNFGPATTVPDQFRGRLLHRHNPAVTLMRTTADECRELGRILAAKMNAGSGPRTVFVPERGFSALSAEGAPFHDPEADAALVGSLAAALDPQVDLVRMDCHMNDPAFADAMADRLHQHFETWTTNEGEA